MLRSCFSVLNFQHVQQKVAIKLRNRKLSEKEDRIFFEESWTYQATKSWESGSWQVLLSGFTIMGFRIRWAFTVTTGLALGDRNKVHHIQKEHISTWVAAEKTLNWVGCKEARDVGLLGRTQFYNAAHNQKNSFFPHQNPTEIHKKKKKISW